MHAPRFAGGRRGGRVGDPDYRRFGQVLRRSVSAFDDRAAEWRRGKRQRLDVQTLTARLAAVECGTAAAPRSQAALAAGLGVNCYTEIDRSPPRKVHFFAEDGNIQELNRSFRNNCDPAKLDV